MTEKDVCVCVNVTVVPHNKCLKATFYFNMEATETGSELGRGAAAPLWRQQPVDVVEDSDRDASLVEGPRGRHAEETTVSHLAWERLEGGSPPRRS